MATYTLAAAVVSGFRVRLTVAVTSPTVGATMTLYRASGGAEELVAGTAAMAATSVVIDDALVPLGRPASYRLAASDAGTATSGTVSVPAESDVLSDPASGMWVECQVADYGEHEVDNLGDSARIMGSPEVVTFHDVESMPAFPLVVHTYDRAQDAAMRAMCASGGPLLLRWASDDGEPDWVLQPLQGRRRYRYASSDPIVRHSWPLMQATARDLDTPAKGDTYADLKDYLTAGATYATMKATWSTYLALKQTDLRAG